MPDIEFVTEKFLGDGYIVEARVNGIGIKFNPPLYDEGKIGRITRKMLRKKYACPG